MSKLFWCEIPGCNRGETFPGEKKPFTRKDKRDEHMRRPHRAPDGHDAWIGTPFGQPRAGNTSILGTGHSHGPAIIDALPHVAGSSGAGYSTGPASIGHAGQPNVAVPNEFVGFTGTNYATVVATGFLGADRSSWFAGFDEHISMQEIARVWQLAALEEDIIHNESGLSTGDSNLNGSFLADDLEFNWNAM